MNRKHSFQISSCPHDEDTLKGTAIQMITIFYMKDLNKPCILIPVSFKSVEKCYKLWVFEYLQMDCNGSRHIVGLVTSLSLIKYA